MAGWTRLTYPRSLWLTTQLGRPQQTAAKATEAETPGPPANAPAANAVAAAEGAAAAPSMAERAETIYAGIAASADKTQPHGPDGPAAVAVADLPQPTVEGEVAAEEYVRELLVCLLGTHS